MFNAVDSWLCQDITERRKFAKDLLSKVRLQLLSTPAVNEVLIRVTSIYHECSNITEAVLVDKEQLNKTICNITSRYSNQTNFNTLVCGGNNVNISKTSNDVNTFDANNLSEVNWLPITKEARYFFEAVCIKGEVYVFDGIDKNDIIVRSVEKYSPITNKWKY